MRTDPKKIIILRHGGGRLGNQLWLYATIYAYCLERKYQCLNYSFYNYSRYFNLPTSSFLTRILKIISYFQLGESHASTYSIYLLYKWLTNLVTLIKKGVVLQHHSDELFYLPPSKNINRLFQKKLKLAEEANKIIYFDGSNFINPIGIKKYHQQITTLLKPKARITRTIDNFLKPVKNYYLVGVHIRQGDYKRFWNGSLYYSQSEVAKRLRYYLKNIYKGKRKVKFIIVSDGKINSSIFKEFNIKLGIGSPIEDLFTLSRCNLIVASKSSFSSFAAYYGGVPLLIFDREKFLKPYDYYQLKI